MQINMTLLKSQHAAIVAANDDLDELLSGTYTTASARLPGVRSKLAKLIAEHMAAENEQLHQPLQAKNLTGRIPDYEEIASQTRELRISYSVHITKWRMSAIENDWPSYVSAARGFGHKLREVLSREEREVFPLAASLLSQST